MKQQLAIKWMIRLLIGLLIFHVCIVIGIIPYDITWGGRLKNDSEMYAFESVSIAINLFLLSILSIKGQYTKEWIPIKAVNIFLWIFLVLFALNTVGNIIAKTYIEKFFSIITFGFVVLIWIILRRDK